MIKFRHDYFISILNGVDIKPEHMKKVTMTAAKIANKKLKEYLENEPAFYFSNIEYKFERLVNKPTSPNYTHQAKVVCVKEIEDDRK